MHVILSRGVNMSDVSIIKDAEENVPLSLVNEATFKVDGSTDLVRLVAGEVIQVTRKENNFVVAEVLGTASDQLGKSVEIPNHRSVGPAPADFTKDTSPEPSAEE